MSGTVVPACPGAGVTAVASYSGGMSLSPLAARRVFLTVAVVEAVTWVGLLVGMLFKYVIATTEAGVHLFGPLHGSAFIAYLVAVALVRRPLGWSLPVTFAALVCSVPPFASVAFEQWADRTGRLGRARVAERVPELV